ncbi:unnamed protein product [Phyllotreta striolata]|uniref:Uncharacterized protein n=1 Tax=Phyllotreta striolata TaxID=444603 RepID=A0A9N9TY51_PHYSR|nr:unnamed protein product [Phyllotreta striolata]
MKYLLLFSCLVGASLARNLPSFVEVCRPKHVDVNKCIQRNVDYLKGKFDEGIPELLIPSFKPFIIPNAFFQLGSNLQMEVKNLKLYLPQSFSLPEMRADLKNIKFYMKLHFPLMHMLTDYNLNGKLLIINLNSTGSGTINITDMVADVVANGKLHKKKGKDYITITDIDIKPKIKSLDLNLNLFPNNAELHDTVRKLYRDNEEVLKEDFIPVVVKIVKDIIMNLVNNFFDNFSFDTLFPDD